MKKKHLLILTGVLVLMGISFISYLSSNDDCKYVPREESSSIENKGYRGAAEWLKDRRADKNGKIDAKAELDARNHAQSMSKLKSTSETVMEWNIHHVLLPLVC